MELSKLAGLAKRAGGAALSGELEFLVRSIGEASSKAEEDAIVQRMINISRQQIREGLSTRKGDNTKSLKDLLVYLIYIDMLGHDTSWASAAVIQLCSHKSLVVKKAAYLATSLLIDPSSELTILVTATIQADLKSDNFLVVCNALQAIARCTGPELVSVFLPQVMLALRHDRDFVKKKALLALHRLLQLDPSIAPDLERVLVEKLGYKEPSVMVAALCGLHELIRADPAPYRSLVHYFTNILKQAAEGKLGRSWDYHRAPAPFVQIALLRLLTVLGAGDPAASANMQAVVLEVWRRADGLASSAGNALVLECMRAATGMYPSDTMLSMALQGVGRFLHATDNNLRFAGIDILARLVDGDPGRVEAHQAAIVECLRSPDVTLKRKTLDLLFKMAGPDNVKVVAEEVLAYLKDGGDDEAPRRAAATQLVTIAERLAPSPQWFCDTVTTLLCEAPDAAPAAAADALVRAVAEGSGDAASDADLRRHVAQRSLALLERPKLPQAMLRLACWVAGEYGLKAGQAYDSVVDKVAAVLEVQAAGEGAQAAVASALGKLAVRAGRPLPAEAAEVLEALSASEVVAVQQTAVEMAALVQAGPEAQHSLLPAGPPPVDPQLAFLDGYVAAAERSGAPPYLSLEDRVAMGVTRNPQPFLTTSLTPGRSPGGLKFEAYERAQPGAMSSTPPAAPAQPAGGDLFFDGLDLGGLSVSDGAGASAPTAAAAAAPAPAVPPVEQELRVNKAGRRWGPQMSRPAPPTAAAAGPSLPANPTEPWRASNEQTKAAPAAAPPAMDPTHQRLADSLFSRSSGSAARSGAATRAAPSAAAKAPEVDLLGDVMGGGDMAGASAASSRGTNAASDLMAGLAGLDVGGSFGAAAGIGTPPAMGNAFDLDLLGGGMVPGQQQQPETQGGVQQAAGGLRPGDPFADLLG